MTFIMFTFQTHKYIAMILHTFTSNKIKDLTKLSYKSNGLVSSENSEL